MIHLIDAWWKNCRTIDPDDHLDVDEKIKEPRRLEMVLQN